MKACTQHTRTLAAARLMVKSCQDLLNPQHNNVHYGAALALQSPKGKGPSATLFPSLFIWSQ